MAKAIQNKYSKKYIDEVLNDYRIANESRQVSLLGRREVLTGKAKFGIFGDGKEIPQLALNKVFREGDWRAGYYRDQTFMFASGIMTLEEFFAQLYGDTDDSFNPQTAGRLMNNHFAGKTLDNNGNWLNLTKNKNSSADISPTAGHMLRLLGLALASKLFRSNKTPNTFEEFSVNGNDVAFGTIGDASTSEGYFFESLNAAGVLQVPLAISIWDDGYGISVPQEYQTIKQSISEALKGFEKTGKQKGYYIYKAKGWDYPELCRIYSEGINKCRKEHVPVIFHISELTQPQGHSTSGSHERYKSQDRLKWELEFDGIKKMREWILAEKIANVKTLEAIEEKSVSRAKEARKNAWGNYNGPLKEKRKDFIKMVDISTCNCAKTDKIDSIKKELNMVADPIRKDIVSSGRKILRLICDQCSNPKNSLKINVTKWLEAEMKDNNERYSSFLYSRSSKSVLKLKAVSPKIGKNAPWTPGRLVL